MVVLGIPKVRSERIDQRLNFPTQFIQQRYQQAATSWTAAFLAGFQQISLDKATTHLPQSEHQHHKLSASDQDKFGIFRRNAV